MKAFAIVALFSGFLTVAGFETPAAAGRQELVLEDLLGKPWVREPVSFPIEAGEGECRPDSVRLEGPDGPVACQLSDMETWPGTPFLKSAKIWFVTGLAPMERRVYTVRKGPAPATDPLPADDLQVTAAPGGAEFATSRFGVRLRLGGETFPEPVAASEVRGPVQALRMADGTWFGGSDFRGHAKISGWSAEMTAEGPVFAEVQYRYEYEDGNRLDVTVRQFARADRVQFDVRVHGHSPEDGLRIVLSRGLDPLTLHVQKLFWSTRHTLWPDDETFHKTQEALAEPLASPAYGGRHEGFCK